MKTLFLPTSEQVRFLSKVRLEDDHFLWTAYVGAKGYGRFNYRGNITTAHRASYEMFCGPIPEGRVIDHLCKIKICVTPWHLEAVTSHENTRRYWHEWDRVTGDEVVRRSHLERTDLERGLLDYLRDNA